MIESTHSRLEGNEGDAYSEVFSLYHVPYYTAYAYHGVESWEAKLTVIAALACLDCDYFTRAD
jgi:hypothetical protein